MSMLVEMLSGVMRYFPNTMIVTLFVVGIATGKLAWVLAAIGGVLVAMAALTVQYFVKKAFGVGPMPGLAAIEACSLLPIIKTEEYSAVPSAWTSITSFFTTFIFMNAYHIYTAKRTHGSKETTPVQQRKGIGLISMFAAIILFVFLIVPRYWTSCENIMGLILGLTLGIGGAVFWWYLLSACGADVYPDIHGVMIGLRPASLHNNPVACMKK
jgi:hypothetical protein